MNINPFLLVYKIYRLITLQMYAFIFYSHKNIIYFIYHNRNLVSMPISARFFRHLIIDFPVLTEFF